MTPHPLQILLVDDDRAIQRLLKKWLEAAGHRVTVADDGLDAQRRILDECPQLVLTDWEMPDVDGVGLCQWLRRQETPNYVYTIFLTSRTTSEDMITALEAGADDFMKKPVDKAELLARVRSATRVLDLESRLNILARTDPMTGLITRKTFMEMVEREWTRANRHLFPLSCVMVDIDYFKRINDSYGHRAGDTALKNVARILQQNCRSSDVVARYGGEEFCVLLPETSEVQAVQWADRVRQTIASTPGLVKEAETLITASFGVAQRLADTQRADELVDLADQALLVAKRSGRDRVIGYQSISNNANSEVDPGGPVTLFEDKVAKDVMATIVAGLKQDDTVGTAARFFLRFRFNSAPVVDADGNLVGILSERDVMSIMLWPHWWRTKIKDVMRCNVVCYDEQTPVLMIYEFLCRVSIRGVVIVRGGKPIGMISRASLLRWFTHLLSLNPREFGSDVAEFSLTGGEGTTPRSQANAMMLIRSIESEAESMRCRLQQHDCEVVPAVIGGVSRIEEILGDLLSCSRYMGALQDEFRGANPEIGHSPAGSSSLSMMDS